MSYNAYPWLNRHTRYKYTRAEIEQFKANPRPFRRKMKWAGTEIRPDGTLWQNNKRIVSQEDVENTIHEAWKETALGRDKLYEWIAERCANIVTPRNDVKPTTMLLIPAIVLKLIRLNVLSKKPAS